MAASFVGQGVISRFDPSLTPDGKWGRFTQSRYEALGPAERFAVDAALRGMGTGAAELLTFREQERVVGQFSVDSADVKATVLKAAAEAGIDPKTAVAYAMIESNMGSNTGGAARKKRFPNGFHGVMQMGSAAWSDAQKVDPSVGPFTVEAAYDTYTNAKAAFAFAKNNIRVARRLGWDGVIDATSLYMMHQQGAAGFAWLWSKWTGKEVRLPKSFTIPSSNLTGNSPQDGRGPTSNATDFIKRWHAVVEAKTNLA
jgi:hypothetical protein